MERSPPIDLEQELRRQGVRSTYSDDEQPSLSISSITSPPIDLRQALLEEQTRQLNVFDTQQARITELENEVASLRTQLAEKNELLAAKDAEIENIAEKC